MQGDTIAAIATAMGEASIAMVRVSGPHAIAVVDRVYCGGIALDQRESHTVAYGRIVSLVDRQPIDEVLVTIMHAPRTYTTEDVVEVTTHGGWQAVRDVLAEIVGAGARLAEPGEFTKRAFLGGRIDLAQAEGIMELVGAQSAIARRAALLQVGGSLTELVKGLRQEMLSLLAQVEVTIDYPEHDEEFATAVQVEAVSIRLLDRLGRLLEMSENGRVLREGIRMAIVGMPNVGKSSILNQLVRADRAIVTEVPGTTRDVLEEHITIGGIPIHVLDTAGIRKSDDLVERIGIERSRKAVRESDLLLVVLDGSRPLLPTDWELLQLVAGTPSLVILNKSDLPAKVCVSDIADVVDEDSLIGYSVFAPDAHVELERKITERIIKAGIQPSDMTFIATSRHVTLLKQARESLQEVVTGAHAGQTLDLLAVDLQQAWMTLGEIIGETPRDDLLDQIFAQFCLGK